MHRTARACTLAGLLALPLAACAPHPGATPIAPGRAATTPTATATARAAAPTLITEPDQGMTPIYDYLGSATSSIDMTMYALQDTQAERILGDEAAKGVTVRVILDGSRDEKRRNTAAYDYLSSRGVSVVWSSPAYTYTHEKSIIVDGSSAAIMTLNLQSPYHPTSRDFAVIDHDAADVAADEATFDADFAHRTVTPSDGDELVWSPTGSQRRLLALINGASSSLLVENEEMGDAAVVDALCKAAEQGVRVQVAMTSSGDDDSELDQLVRAGATIATYSASAPLYIHAKVIVADGTRAFVGSENFSDTSLNDNRELGLITTDRSIVSSLTSTLTSDVRGGAPYSG